MSQIPTAWNGTIYMMMWEEVLKRIIVEPRKTNAQQTNIVNLVTLVILRLTKDRVLTAVQALQG